MNPNGQQRRGLEGIRVLEVAGGLGPAWAAKLLADLGADVVRFERPDDEDHDDVRARPHDLHRWLNANKRSMTRNFAELAEEAHILVHGLGPAAASARGLAYAELALRLPRLVVCSITAFGSTGPYADFTAEELNVIHGCSWGFLSPSASQQPELAPLKSFGHHATLQTSTVAAMAALAAFDRAERDGAGDHVDFSLFGAGAKITETAPVAASFQGANSSRLGVKTVIPWGLYTCQDGAIQIICPEQSQWEALVEIMGKPEWATLEVFATLADRRANADVLDLYLSEWMATQTVQELYKTAQAARLCVTPVQTMTQSDNDANLAARGFFAQTPDGLRVPGPGYQLDKPWWALRRDAPSRGDHDEQGWLTPADPGTGHHRAGHHQPEDQPPATGPGERPLSGVRVCDFTWVWAGPMCSQYLAHLGADVIRLESPEHLCLFRRLPFNPPDLPLTPDTAGVFHLYNSDKRSVVIDLGHREAKEVVRRLVAVSDVVIDNFAVGTMAALGFGVEDLRRINPDVIVASLTGYGQTGPSADYMAYGPAGGAMAGLYSVTGYEDGPPCETGIAVGDPCTGITAAWAIVAALTARRRTGEAARVDVAMVEAVAATLGEPWMEYLATGSDPRPGGNHDPSWSPHDCYRAAGEDAWVTIACTSEAQWRRLCAVIDPALAEDPRFADVAARKANEVALDERIGAWTARLDRWDVTHQLQLAAVAAFPSQSPLDLWGGEGDPQLRAIGMLERPDHPAVGPYVIPGIPWRLTTGLNGLRRPAPLLGEHTEEVLTELLGLTPDEVERLQEAGALPAPPVLGTG